MQGLFGGCSDISSVPRGIAVLLEVQKKKTGVLAIGYPAGALMCSILSGPVVFHRFETITSITTGYVH